MMKTHVEKDNFGKQSAHNKDKQHPQEPLLVFRLAAGPCNDGGAQALGRHDTQATDPAADGDVDQHILLTIFRSDEESDYDGSNNDDACVGEKAWCDDVFLHFFDVGDGGFLGCVHNDDDRPHDTEKACHFADQAKSLLEKDGRQNSGDDDGQRTKWCNQDSIGEGVCDKVAHLANNHEDHARPPVGVLEVAIAFASSFVVFRVCLQQADLFEDKGRSNKETRPNRQTNADGLVVSRSHRAFASRHDASSWEEEIIIHGGFRPAALERASRRSVGGEEERKEGRECRFLVSSLITWASRGIDGKERYGFVGAVGVIDDATGRSKVAVK